MLTSTKFFIRSCSLYTKRSLKKSPRLTIEANKYLNPIGKWFGEDSFTCIRVFDRLSHPHVLHLFSPNKLLAKEGAYQTVVKGLTKVLKDAKKFA